MEEHIYQKLKAYSKSDYYPFHMPGHKRNMAGYEMEEAYSVDITEIDGFDNLHHAQGILLDAMKRASALYKSEETHFLVNGSTCGILSAISATVGKHGKILLARNCHKAAYNAVYLRELHPVYLYPKMQKEYSIYDEIVPEDVEKALSQNADIDAVFITSPTYDGVVSNVAEIAEITHKYGIPLIVDEAHGAHFGFCKEFPRNSVTLGADIVIHSVHKTLPAFTQTALIHINGNLVDRIKLNRFLQIYQTSSPSYVLMSGIDNCMSIMKERGDVLFRDLHQNITDFLQECMELEYIKIFQKKDAAYDFDQSKIVLSVKESNITGRDLAQILLQKYHLQMEMEAPTYTVAIASIMDTKEGFHRLAAALKEIDKTLTFVEKKCVERSYIENRNVIVRYQMSQLDDMEMETVLLEKSANRISAEFIYLYPPGIPIVVPGEMITEAILESITEYQQAKYAVQGLQDYELKHIKVVK